MMSGDRGPILQIIIAYFTCYCILDLRKYNIIIIVAAVAVGAFIISFLAFFRHYDGTGNLIDMIRHSSAMQADMVSSQMSVSPSTFELSKSVRTMHASVSYTEDNGYSYGIFQGFQLIGIIPGLGSLFTIFFGIDNEMLKSSRFLTNHLGSDHGLGTTVVADIWLDFGIIGILVIFFIFGAFLRRVDENMYSRIPLSVFWYILIIVFISKAFYIGRSTILILFRDVVIGYIIMLVGIYVIGYNKNKRVKS